MTATATPTTPSTEVQRQRAPRAQRQREHAPHVLDPAGLPDQIDALYRAAWALCGSRQDAEDLVQTTLARVLQRPRIIRNSDERGYLLRALRNAYSSRYRKLASQPQVQSLREDDTRAAAEPTTTSRELMEAIATAPTRYRDAVIAVDVLGLSYREAARSLRTREDTIASRLFRGRQHIAGELTNRSV
ncbi:MAG: RNA polymerase sigma factor [Solirubrobacteraceae bacterium]